MDSKTLGWLNEGYNDAEDTSYIFDAIEKDKERQIWDKLEKVEKDIKSKIKSTETKLQKQVDFLQEKLNKLVESLQPKEIEATTVVENTVQKREKLTFFEIVFYPILWIRAKTGAREIDNKPKYLRTSKEKFILAMCNVLLYASACALLFAGWMGIIFGFMYLKRWFLLVILGGIITWRLIHNHGNIGESFLDIGKGIWAGIKGIGSVIGGLIVIGIIIAIIGYVISGIGLPRFLALLFFA